MTPEIAQLDAFELEDLLEQGRAQEVYESVRKRMPDAATSEERASLLGYLGSACIGLEKTDEGRTAFTEAHTLWTQAGDHANAVEVLIEGAELELETRAYADAERLLHRALETIDDGLSEAEKENNEALEESLTMALVDALLALSDLHLRRGTAEDGLVYAHQAVECAETLQDPRAYFAYEILGQLLLDTGETVTAEEVFACALECAPTDMERAECALLLLRCAELAGDTERVRSQSERLEKACIQAQVDPENRDSVDRIRAECASLRLSAGVDSH